MILLEYEKVVEISNKWKFLKWVTSFGEKCLSKSVWCQFKDHIFSFYLTPFESNSSELNYCERSLTSINEISPLLYIYMINKSFTRFLMFSISFKVIWETNISWHILSLVRKIRICNTKPMLFLFQRSISLAWKTSMKNIYHIIMDSGWFII